MEMGLMGIIILLLCIIIIKTIMIMSIWRSAMSMEVDEKVQKSIFFPGDLLSRYNVYKIRFFFSILFRKRGSVIIDPPEFLGF